MAIKGQANHNLKNMAKIFRRMSSKVASPAITPEPLLKSKISIVMFGVQSDR